MLGIEERLPHCLYFSTQNLARMLATLADDAFKPTGLSPSHGYTLFLILDNPGSNLAWLSEQMHLAPSTISRFVDKLQLKGLIERTQDGRNMILTVTSKGKELKPLLHKASETVYKSMINAFGEDEYNSSRDKIVNLASLLKVSENTK